METSVRRQTATDRKGAQVQAKIAELKAKLHLDRPVAADRS